MIVFTRQYKSRSKFAALVLALSAGALAGCGGGGSGPASVAAEQSGNNGAGQSGSSSQSGSSGRSGAADDSDISPSSGRLAPKGRLNSLAACEPMAGGKDYQVGSGPGQRPTLDQVPWESLAAGDTVRIFHQASPHRGKFLVTANGTAERPVRVCGVRGPNGERPIIDGSGATTRRGLSYGGESSAVVQESRSVVMIKNNSEDFTHFPSYIQIDGLAIRSAHPDYRFVDSNGTSQEYSDFGGCIWIDRGQNITIADNEITDCTNGLFSKSTDDGDFALTRNLRIVGNYIHGNGIVESDRLHNSYLQSVGIVYEFNFYGPLRKNAWGAALKDRSIGTVVRYNRIEEGAHSIDLVEAEDYVKTALASPAYRTSYVYGNQIVKSGDSGSFFHYGGDHYDGTPNGNYGEPFFRKGTLYFFHNTVYITGTYTVLFNLSTTEERGEVWNNVFYFWPSTPWAMMRQTTDIGSAWTAGGILNLGKNWINSKWVDSDPDHPVPGQLNGRDNMLLGSAPPIDVLTLVPLAGSSVIDAAQPPPASLVGHPVDFQLDENFMPRPRRVSGAGPDLGAVER